MKEKKYSAEFIRTLFLWGVGSVSVGALLLFPDKLYFEAVVYTIMLMITLTFMVNFKKIQEYATHRVNRTPEQKFYGIGERPLLGLFLGIFFGGAFLFLTKLKILGALTMAIPTLPLSLTGQGFVVTIIAPVVETLFFGVFLFSFFNLFFGLLTSMIFRSLVFSSYHYFAYVVYGSSSVESIIGAFIGAFIFGLLGSVLAIYIGSEADATAHATFNFSNWNEVYQVFSIV